MTTEHRSAIKAEIRAALQADEQHLARFHYLLTVVRNRLTAAPDNHHLWLQVEILEDIIAVSEGKIAALRKILGRLSSAEGLV
jgi:hypothetical protein